MSYFILVSIFLFTTIIFSILGIKSKFFILKNKVVSYKQFSINSAAILLYFIIILAFIEGTFDTFSMNGIFYDTLKKLLNSFILLVSIFYGFAQMLKQIDGSGQFDELSQLLNPIYLFFPLQMLRNNLMLINLVDINKKVHLNNDIKKIGSLKNKLNRMNNYDLYSLSTYLKVILTKEKLFFNGFTLACFSLIGGYLLNKTTFVINGFGNGFFLVTIILTVIFLFLANVVNKNLFLLSIVVEDVIREKEKFVC